MLNNKFLIIIILVSFSICFVSCAEKKSEKEENKIEVKKPKPFIERDEIVDLIVDLELAEAAIKTMSAHGESTAKTVDYYYDYMFEKWGITFQEYNDIINYYSQDPKEMEEIYADVISKLSEMQSKVRSQ